MTAHTATPQAEVDITPSLAHALLREQHPDLAPLPITLVAEGWDNVMFRLGDELALRMPRRAAAASLIEVEQRWLPTIAPHLPLTIPAPIRIGLPIAAYPWRWSVLPWLAGAAADQSPLHASQSLSLAQFLKKLHRPAPADAPRSRFRGVPLSERADAVEERLTRLENTTSAITAEIRERWREALTAQVDVDDTWIHGDLHARNVLSDQGRLGSVIDWGDLCQGDRATDLAAIWMLLPDVASRRMAMQAYEASPATWQRARGWAIFFGSILLDTGLRDEPRHAAMGELTLRRVAEGP